MSGWIRSSQPQPAPALRLFCCPYAGGNSMMFRSWAVGLPNQVEVCAIQLPGHGDRIKEPPLTSVASVVEALIPEILPQIDRPYAFFGHSMGALICFELARQLRSHAHPKLLFLSGRRAPQIRDRTPQLHTLPDAELVAELRQFNGTPQQVLDNPEMMQLFLPTLRADFSICGTYQYQEAAPLDCSIVVFGGNSDRAEPPELLKGWKRHTTRSFSQHLLPGDHFFLHAQQQSLLALITEQLVKVL